MKITADNLKESFEKSAKSQARNNILHLVIDALRPTVFDDPEMNTACWPNLSGLIREGFFSRGISNAQATQIIAPTMFTLRYPLDEGGYSKGVCESNATLAERLSAVGYHAEMHSLCAQLGVSNGFQRGFKETYGTIDYRFVLMYFCQHYFRTKVALYQKNLIGLDDVQDIVTGDYKRLVQSIIDDFQTRRTIKRYSLPELLNRFVVKDAKRELALISKNPDIVTRRMIATWPQYMASRLGKVRVSALDKTLERVHSGMGLRLLSTLCYSLGLGPLKYGRCSLIADSFELLRRSITRSEAPWYFYCHWMDVHDYRYFNRPLHRILQLRFWWKWRQFKKKGATNRYFLYDAALMRIDQHLGHLIRTLDKSGKLEETTIVVTSDHGARLAQPAMRAKKEFGLRLNKEDLEIPIIISNPPKHFHGFSGLVDTISVSAGILEIAEAELPEHVRERSHLMDDGIPAVVSENAGRGFCDVDKDRLFFSVVDKSHKGVFSLDPNGGLSLIELYQTQEDQDELINLCSKVAEYGDAVNVLLDAFWSLRSNVLTRRGYRSCRHLKESFWGNTGGAENEGTGRAKHVGIMKKTAVV